jgi:hypothetical protein
MVAKIEHESEAFSCMQKNRFAVLTLKEQAFKMVTDLDVRSDYFSVLSTIEKSSEALGLLQINSIEYFGDEKYAAYLENIAENKFWEAVQPPLCLSRLENSIGQLALIAAKFSKPMVAGIGGNITAGYFGSILAFDFRIAAEDTSLVFPGIKFGFPPSGPMAFYLPRCIGYPRAAEILLSAKPISAPQAFSHGLVTSIVPTEELEEQGLKMLEEITKLPNSAVSAIRGLLQPTEAELEHFLERSYDGAWNALIKLKNTTG